MLKGEMDNKYSLKKNKFGFNQITPYTSKNEIIKFYTNKFYSIENNNFNDLSL